MGQINKIKLVFQNPFNFMLSTFVLYLVFAFIANSPLEIAEGMVRIYASSSVLVEDYIAVGGIGAAFINSAVVGSFSCLVMKKFGCEWSASNVMALWLSCGFAFFGKNMFNIMPIIVGGLIYCWFRKEKVSENMKFILLSTTLAPVVSHMRYIGLKSVIMGYILGIGLGLLVGFVAIPISWATAQAQRGYNLYNMGFAGGIIGLVLSAILRNFGVPLELQAIWSEGNNLLFILFLAVLFIYIILMGCFVSPHSPKEYFNWRFFIVEDARTYDSFHIKGEQSYQNMGTLGLFALFMVVLIGGQISGPIIGGIFTIVGFGSRGKTLLNMFPVVLGCMLAALLIGESFVTPSVILIFLFSTTLAPITNRFGIFWGFIAGFLHFNTVLRIAELHGGLSLYNNGLAGGFVVTFLVPVIFAIRRSPRWKKVRRKYHHLGINSHPDVPGEDEKKEDFY